MRPPAPRRASDQATRRLRAAEREALRQQWLRARHRQPIPTLPFRVEVAPAPGACAGCGKPLATGARLVAAPAPDRDAHLCLTCGRRAVLGWADERRRESSLARRFAQDLGRTASTTAPPARAVA